MQWDHDSPYGGDESQDPEVATVCDEFEEAVGGLGVSARAPAQIETLEARQCLLIRSTLAPERL